MATKKVNPSWLAKAAVDDTSLAGMDEYRILPQFKIVQPTTEQAMKKEFGEGTILVMPGNAVAWSDGNEPFDFVPQFFFVSFEKWSDLDDSDSPMVVDQTFDPSSTIARKSRSKEERFEPYPEGSFTYRYVERLRFPGVIHGDHILAGTAVVLSFERGEFWQGKNFISAIIFICFASICCFCAGAIISTSTSSSTTFLPLQSLSILSRGMLMLSGSCVIRNNESM